MMIKKIFLILSFLGLACSNCLADRLPGTVSVEDSSYTAYKIYPVKGILGEIACTSFSPGIDPLIIISRSDLPFSVLSFRSIPFPFHLFTRPPPA
jgi:hypothetical protein